MIAGENAHSRYFSEDAYKAAAEPKELLIIPNAVHVDLYDKLDLIPFDKLEAFFTAHLKGGNRSKTVMVDGADRTKSTLLTQQSK